MRILPRAQRQAMFEIYAFCRQVDDIADSSGPRRERREELDRWRADIDALYAGKPVSRTRGLLAPVRRFGLRREDFHAVIDGMEMGVVADIRAPDEATLEAYCDRVASASRSRIISDGRCNSPTSCAISTRTRRSEGSTCRPKRCAPPASSPPIP